jgi:hypothetical protein
MLANIRQNIFPGGGKPKSVSQNYYSGLLWSRKTLLDSFKHTQKARDGAHYDFARACIIDRQLIA